MRKLKIRPGTVFHDLKVVSYVGMAKGSSQFVCKCVCGKVTTVAGFRLNNNHTKSCGCLAGRKLSKQRKCHGLSGTPIYRCWQNMLNRCRRKKGKKYHRYGGRDIKVCDRWLLFENFYDDMGDIPKGKTLDRENNNGDYESRNCRWATHQQQANNKSTNHFITMEGITKTIAEWCRYFDISQGVVYQRLKNGWKIETAIQTSTGKTGVAFKLPMTIECKGKVLTVQQWSKETGLNTSTIYSRLKRGWSEVEAVDSTLKFSQKQNNGRIK